MSTETALLRISYTQSLNARSGCASRAPLERARERNYLSSCTKHFLRPETEERFDRVTMCQIFERVIDPIVALKTAAQDLTRTMRPLITPMVNCVLKESTIAQIRDVKR